MTPSAAVYCGALSASSFLSLPYRLPLHVSQNECRCSFRNLSLAHHLSLPLLVSIRTHSTTALNKLESTEYGVEYTKWSKQLDDAAQMGGLHSGPPGFEFIKFPSTFITETLPQDICLSQDGLRVAYDVTFQYQVLEENLLPVILKYRDFNKWTQVVSMAGASAVQHSCSEFNISNFQNQRGIIQTRMEENLRWKLEGDENTNDPGVYALVVSLQLQNVDLPSQYSEAVAQKQAAAEDIALSRNQRLQEITKATTLLLSANQEASKINNTAYVNSEVILTEAMLKAEETLHAFQNEADVLVSAKDSYNLTTDGVLAFMANRLYAEVPKLKVSAGEPARLSRKDEL